MRPAQAVEGQDFVATEKPIEIEEKLGIGLAIDAMTIVAAAPWAATDVADFIRSKAMDEKRGLGTK